MKRFLIIFIYISAFGITQAEVYNFYKNHNYIDSCKKGLWNVSKFKEDDNYQSIVALSCVKIGMLNTAIRITKSMTHTPIGRHNASYIASLYLIKKLLLQMVHDNINISNLSLPESDHFLSIIFENISHNNFSKVNNKYVVEKDGIKYILSPKNNDKFEVKIYKNNNLISTHTYW